MPRKGIFCSSTGVDIEVGVEICGIIEIEYISDIASSEWTAWVCRQVNRSK
jgi:hypothetical protein